MATPRNNAYTGTAGSTLYAGQAKPQWYESAPSGSWVELPNSIMSASGVGYPGGRDIAGFPTNSDYRALILAWSGGVLNTVGVKHEGAFIPGTFMVLFGGGHGDYAGNELYAYGPLQANPVWRRLNDPTIPPPNNVSRDGSGNPVSRHSYDSLVFLPTVNKMICFGSPASFQLANDRGGCDLFDFATNTWSQQDAGYQTGDQSGGGMTNGFTGYDSATGKAWALGNGNSTKIVSYHADTGSWTGRTWFDNPDAGSDQKAALSPSLNLLVHVNTAGVVSAFRLSDTSLPKYNPVVQGAHPTETKGRVALEWHEGYGAFVACDSDGALFRLTPGANPLPGGDPWVWTRHVMSGAAIPAATGSPGVFGRWRRVPASGVMPSGMVLMRHHDSPIVFLKD